MPEQTLLERKELEVVADANATTTADIAATSAAGEQKTAGRPDSLFSYEEGRDFRKRWEQIQTEFVDDPRDSVQKADQLVAATIKRLAEVFADERARLEGEWAKGNDNVSTEDLRQALRKYRSFFDRLLSV